MKKFKSTGVIAAVCLIAASIFGVLVGLQLLCFCFGFGELLGAKEYYDNNQKKPAFLSLSIGVFVCVCAFLSVTNIIGICETHKPA